MTECNTERCTFQLLKTNILTICLLKARFREWFLNHRVQVVTHESHYKSIGIAIMFLALYHYKNEMCEKVLKYLTKLDPYDRGSSFECLLCAIYIFVNLC